MKKTIYIILIISSIFKINAQDTLSLNNKIFKINILNPGLSFEKSISNKNSLSLDANLALVYTYSNNLGSRLLQTPFARLQFRHYYNLEKRKRKGKDISRNSGNYYGLNSSYYLNTINDKFYININDGFNLGLTWGFQKTYKNGLNINLNTGINYNFSQNKIKKIVPLLSFTVGYIIFDE